MNRSIAALVVPVGLALALAACGGSKSGSSSSTSGSQGSFQLQPPDGSTLPDATIGAVYSQTIVVVSGGTGPFTFGTSGLPPGLSLSYLPPNAVAIQGTPATSSPTGTAAVQILVTDSTQASEVATYALTVTSSTLQFSPATLPNSVAGTPYTQTISVTGGVAPYAWSLSGNVPTGLSLQSSTTSQDTLQGFTTRRGTFTFQVVVVDSSPTPITSSQSYTVIVQ